MGKRSLRKENKDLEFVASFPPIQSAILVDGNGDGARLQIDISRQERHKINNLYELMGKVFKLNFKKM